MSAPPSPHPPHPPTRTLVIDHADHQEVDRYFDTGRPDDWKLHHARRSELLTALAEFERDGWRDTVRIDQCVLDESQIRALLEPVNAAHWAHQP